MYSQIGKKIKMLAVFLCLLEALGTFIGGIVIIAMAKKIWFIGLIIMLSGPILSLITSWLMYGFGELIDKTSNIEREICKKKTVENAQCQTEQARTDEPARNSQLKKQQENAKYKLIFPVTSEPEASSEAREKMKTEKTVSNKIPIDVINERFGLDIDCVKDTVEDKKKKLSKVKPICEDEKAFLEEIKKAANLDQLTSSFNRFSAIAENDKAGEWRRLERKHGVNKANCNCCGHLRRLVPFEFEDFFGKTIGNLCYECFALKHKD